MMTELQATTVVDAPLRQVYDQWTQFEDFPQFMSAVRQVSQLDDARMWWVVDIAGVERAFEATITEQVPDERIRWESVDEKVHAGEVAFERHTDGTQVTLTMNWLPEGIVEQVGATLNLDELAVERDLERFKAFLEERDAPTGAWRGRVEEPSATDGTLLDPDTAEEDTTTRGV